MNLSPAHPARASVLVGALIGLVLLQLVVATVVLAGGRDAQLSRERIGQARAFYNAESAAAMALRELRQGTDLDGDARIGGVSDDNNDANNPQLNGGSLKAVYTQGTPASTITTSGAALQSRRGPVISVIEPAAASPTRPGLYFEAWNLSTHVLVDAFNWSQQPHHVGWVHVPWWPNQSTNNLLFAGSTRVAARLTGKITVTTPGIHTFSIDVDDDVKLLVNGVQVLHRNANGGCARRSGSINLTAGDHDYQILFTDGGGAGCLMALWQPPGTSAAVPIPPSAFSWSPAARLPSLATTGSLTLSGGGSPATAASLYAWDASQGAYSDGLRLSAEADIATNATTNNSINATNGATVDGDVRSGVGSNPASAIYFGSNATYSGSRAALATRIAIPIHGLPSGLPSSSGSLSLSGNQSQTISTTRRYNSVSLSNNATLTIAGDVTLYVTGSFTISNSASLVVTDGSILRLHVDGALSISNAGHMNTSALPGRCYIYMRGSGQAFTLSNTGRCHAHLRNPLGQVNISSESDNSSLFTGTIAAASANISNRAALRLDCGPLGSGGGGGGGGGGLAIVGYAD